MYGNSSQNQNMPGQNQAYGQSQNYFKVDSRGRGISDQEYQALTSSCYEVLGRKPQQLAPEIIKAIKQKIGGEWYVFVVPVHADNYDFYLSTVSGGDSLKLEDNQYIFHICRIKQAY